MSTRAASTPRLSVLLRPALLVLSMFLCMIIMSATGSLISALFQPFMTASGVTMTTGNLGFTATIALLFILGAVIGLLTWKLFELVTAVPDRIIRWVGQLLANLGDEARGMGQQAAGQATSEGRSMMGTGGKVMAQRRGQQANSGHQRNDAGRGEGRGAHAANDQLAMKDLPPNTYRRS